MDPPEVNLEVTSNHLSSTSRLASSSGRESIDRLDSWSLDVAVDVLDVVVQASEGSNMAFQRRAQMINDNKSIVESEAPAYRQQQLAYIEHLRSTIEALLLEVKGPRKLDLRDSTLGALDVLSASSIVMKTKTSISPTLFSLPLASPASTHQSTAKTITSVPLRNDRSDERMMVSATDYSANTYRSTFLSDVGSKLVSTREEKMREIFREAAHWKLEYEAMREQVVAEKIRQVELFYRLEMNNREYFQRNLSLQEGFQEAQNENELLQSQLAEARSRLAHQRKTLEDIVRAAREEKESLVCTIAETRHKFKEWKDGEASTLKAARDQAVHTLKTEYELKIARHHLEKQKLRDKVKDLEVSLRLMQKDRHLSPQELSLRKAMIRDNRRRSFMSPPGVAGVANSNLVTTREQYLMNALFKVQSELDSLRDGARKSQRNLRENSRRNLSEKKIDATDESVSDESSSYNGSDSEDEGIPLSKADGSDSASKLVLQRETAVRIIQNRSKGYLTRRDFMKKKEAIDKIKAQYRGYLVRKNMELVDFPYRPFIISDATQVKVQIIEPHFDLEMQCLNKPVRTTLRVSKEPPVVQIVVKEIMQSQPNTSQTYGQDAQLGKPSAKTYYFHLFEIVALLPMDDVTTVLEQTSESEIAQTIGQFLQVVMVAGE